MPKTPAAEFVQTGLDFWADARVTNEGIPLCTCPLGPWGETQVRPGCPGPDMHEDAS